MKLKLLALADVLMRYGRVARASWALRRSMDPVHRTSEELAFQPAVIELTDSPVSPAPRVMLYLISVLIIVSIAWASFGHLDIVATASGKIVGGGRTKTIQSVETAIVRQILVNDGQHVAVGQPLIELDAVGMAADADKARRALLAQELNAVRAAATADALEGNVPPTFVAPNGVSHDELDGALRLAANQFEAFRRKTDGLRAAIAQKEAELKTTKESIAPTGEYAKIAVDRVADYRRLLDKKYVSRQDYLTREQERISAQRDLLNLEDRLRELASGVDVARQELATTISDTRRQLLDEEREAREQISELRAESARAAERGRSLHLISPVNGTVQQLAVHTTGGVVTSAQPIMSIVPDDDSLEVEATILNQDIGFVRAGQDVVVKVQSYPYTRYGHLSAHVVSVSRDAVSDEKLGLIFPARVKLDRSSMNIDGATVMLTPGMAVTVDIMTGKRTALEYILDPLRAQVDESLHER